MHLNPDDGPIFTCDMSDDERQQLHELDCASQPSGTLSDPNFAAPDAGLEPFVPDNGPIFIADDNDAMREEDEAVYLTMLRGTPPSSEPL